MLVFTFLFNFHTSAEMFYRYANTE